MSDKKQSHRFSRRVFSGGLLSIAALARKSWAGLLASDAEEVSGYAYVGAPQTLHVFKMDGGRWRRLQTVTAAEPVHLEPHPLLPVLYVVHQVDRHDHLPRGAVSTYAIEDGLLRHKHTQPLSLSATLPVHASASPDGRYLAVAAEQGGIYNLLPIGPDGSLENVTGIIKDFARTNVRSARPRCVAWHLDGTSLLTVDSGNDSVSSLVAKAGRLERVDRCLVHSGAGASHLAVSSDGRHVYALHAEDGTVLVQAFDPVTRCFDGIARAVAQLGREPSVLAARQGSGLLVIVGSVGGPTTLTAWRMNSAGGGLDRLDQVRIGEGQRALCFAKGADRLIGIAAASGAITEWGFDRSTGRFGPARQVAQVKGARSVSASSVDRGRA